MKGFATKVYVVLQRLNVPLPNGDNVKVIATRLTSEAAQSVVDQTPGTFVEKSVASK